MFSVPVADSTVQSSEESDGGYYLSPTGGDDPTMAEAIATVMLRKVRAMIMEAEVDVLPYTNKKVNLECVGKLCTSATRLKRELQEAHMDLEEDNEYKLTLAAQAGACRQKLAEFIVTTEELRVVLEKDDKDQQQASKAVHEDIVPIVAKKILAAGRRLVEVEAAYVGATGLDPDDHAELFEKMERLRIIDTQFSEASSDSKEAWELAVEFKLMDEGADLDRAILAARKAKAFSSDKVLAWRKEAGIWADKKSSSTLTDLKMPTFSAGIAAKTTIYDFEGGWKQYRDAMEYSKEEAVKMLKVAVQQPSRGDIATCCSEEEIFAYLRKHHGNPMVLLNAREKEIRARGPCKGPDMAQRDWLILAKSKPESTLKLCKEHDIERYLHFSSVASKIQSKFHADLTKDFKLIRNI